MAVGTDVRLRNERLHSMGLEFLLAEHSGEESSVVLVPSEVDDEGARKLGFGENHLSISMMSGPQIAILRA